MTFKHALKKFILEHFVRDPKQVDVDDNARLIDQRLIDSMGLMHLMNFIEEETGVRVPDDEVFPDNFQTIESIEQMVQRLRSQKELQGEI